MNQFEAFDNVADLVGKKTAVPHSFLRRAAANPEDLPRLEAWMKSLGYAMKTAGLETWWECQKKAEQTESKRGG